MAEQASLLPRLLQVLYLQEISHLLLLLLLAQQWRCLLQEPRTQLLPPP
jgi:hypothetical protein